MAGATTQAERQQQVLAAGYNGPLTDAAINQAYANAATSSDLASSGITNRPQNASSSGNQTVSSGGTVGTSGQLAQGVQGVLGAASTGNAAALAETIREYDKTFGLDQSKFNDDVRRFNENLQISQAGLTGTYQGGQTQQAQLQAENLAKQRAELTGYYLQPGTGGAGGAAVTPGTLSWNQVSQQLQPIAGAAYNDAAAKAAYQQALGLNPAAFNGGQAAPLTQAQLNAIYAAGGAPAGTAPSTQGQMTTAYQQQQYAQQMGMIAQAATLQANPFRQQQAIGQMGRLLGGGGVAGFSAPNTVAGVGTAGGNTQGGLGYLSQMINDIRDPTANTTSMNDVLNAIPTPNKLNSNEFLRSAPSTQSMVLQGMQEKYGIDPNDALNQIKATLPQFTAPSTTFGTVKR